MPHISQDELAALLGLSRATVSRSLANHPAISSATRERVRAMAIQLGYDKPSRTFSKVARSPSVATLGVIIGRPLVPSDNATLPVILDGIEDRARIEKVHIDVFAHGSSRKTDLQWQKSVFRRIREASWRGAILIYPFSDEFVDVLTAKIPLVTVLTEYPEEAVDSVDTDHGDIRQLVLQLSRLGHHRIGFVSWHYSQESTWAFRRYAAYCEALAHAGLFSQPDWVINIHEKTPLSTSTDQIADKVTLITQQSQVTAWVCAADHQAYQLISDLQKRDLRVPRDCSVVGFDGQPPPPGLPTLSSRLVPNHDIGSAAVTLLISRLQRPNSPRRKILVATELVVGATMAPPPP